MKALITILVCSCISALAGPIQGPLSGGLVTAGQISGAGGLLNSTLPEIWVNTNGVEDGKYLFTNLQHAINYALSTNFGILNSTVNPTNYNNLGYNIRLSQGNFYSPTGYLVNFIYPTSLKIEGGISWGTMISADSNVFVVSSTITDLGNKFEVDNAAIVGISNVVGALVRTPNNSTPVNDMVFNDDAFCTMIGGMTNYTPANNFFIIPANCPLLGLVGLAVYGGNDLIVNHCVFSTLADGILAMNDHCKIQNNQFYSIGDIIVNGTATAQNTNLWSRSDSSSFFGPASEAVQNEELSFGAAYVLDDEGDSEIHGDHIFQTGLGFKLGISQSQTYGVTKIFDEHFEPDGVLEYFIGISDGWAGQQLNVENIYCVGGGFTWKYILIHDFLTPATLVTNQPIPLVGSIYDFDRNNGFNFKVGDTNVANVTSTGISSTLYTGNGAGLTNLPTSALGLRLISTNFGNGQIYTNNYGSTILATANAVLVTAGVSGQACLQLRNNATLANGGATNYSALSTLVTSIATSYTNSISLLIPTNSVYTFTNTSTGAGDSATVIGGQILVY